MSSRRDWPQRLVEAGYSFAAEKIYNPLVARGAFKWFGGRLPELMIEQGRRAVDVATGAPILDMPVGTAYYAAQIASEHDGLLVGVDIAQGMVEEARRTAATAGTANLVAVRADAHRLPFRDATFGAVLSHNGLQVIPGLRGAAAELMRVLEPGGTLFVTIVNAPVGRALPPGAREHLPTFFRPGEDVVTELLKHSGATMAYADIAHERLATVIELHKPLV